MITFEDQILAVETSSYCNLKCPMCTQSKVDYNKKTFMSFELWKKFIDDLKREKKFFKKFLPFGLGEPFFHPKAYEIFDYLFQENKKREIFNTIIFHTNASFMNEKISRLLLKNQYQIGAIHFSIDAASSEVYDKVRPGGNFDMVMRNIEFFIKNRSQIPPKLIFQFIVMEKNYHEGKKFLELFTKILSENNMDFQINYDWFPEMKKDTIFFKRENTWNFTKLKESEDLHKKLVYDLGIIKEIPKGRILESNEFIKK
jgi:sulfatase maturation enzyme AslB (radical SAM superfamily)